MIQTKSHYFDISFRKVSKVIIPDSKKEIYKATLVQLMNDEKLSKNCQMIGMIFDYL